ncbi:MAG: DUF5683 domain-containing protein [Candidatus Electryonea clarkiae]|nr:DUF5683 domain-containing protein [Candidatus Electryonea clarkiae]
MRSISKIKIYISALFLVSNIAFPGSIKTLQAEPDQEIQPTVTDTANTVLDSADVQSNELQPVDVLEEEIPDSTEKDGRMVQGILMHKNPTIAALMSLTIPGLGQAYTEHWIKAGIYFSADFSILYGVYIQNRRYNDSLKLSKQQKTDRLRVEYERIADFYRDDRNRMIWWSAGLTLLATFDAFVEGHLYDFIIDPSLGITPTGDGLEAGITIKMP